MRRRIAVWRPEPASAHRTAVVEEVIVLAPCELVGLDMLEHRVSEHAQRLPSVVVDDRSLRADVPEEPARGVGVVEGVDIYRLDMEFPLVPLRCGKGAFQILLQLPPLARGVVVSEQQQLVPLHLVPHAAADITAV